MDANERGGVYFGIDLSERNALISYYQLDMDWDELNADIGTARYYDEITENQAVYLRQKYLL